ncbi:hypothetical protein EV639_103262 [Rathayibacter tanaceti]|uniref:Peptidase M16 inactive domain protein n=2 Tax=Rathayibacter tanaceti TaxID=1671680 RepID=A0AAE6RHU2_9MICO|nr:insulinase family protein [Rathayibacter tanaceti]QHC54391.1 hypothetical protein GSU10_01060 [Rathayibacter tanaceti]TCO38075.1 hypothetical protein EV639_103262 [Rathayibacter tanaceti]
MTATTPAPPAIDRHADGLRVLGGGRGAVVALVVETRPLSWQGRLRAASLLRRGLEPASAEIDVRPGPSGVSAILPLAEATPEDWDRLLGRLGSWRELADADPAPETPAVPRSLGELGLALALGDAGESPTPSEFSRRPVAVALSAGSGLLPLDLGQRFEELIEAAGRRCEGHAPPLPSTAGPVTESGVLPIPGIRSSLVRILAPLPGASGASEALARSLAALILGGTAAGPLARRLRDDHALSYSPGSALTRLPQGEYFAVEAPVAAGAAERADGLIRDVLTEQSVSPPDDGVVAWALRYARGRRLVDADSPLTAHLGFAARHDGSDPWGLLEHHAPAVDADLVRRQFLLLCRAVLETPALMLVPTPEEGSRPWTSA